MKKHMKEPFNPMFSDTPLVDLPKKEFDLVFNADSLRMEGVILGKRYDGRWVVQITDSDRQDEIGKRFLIIPTEVRKYFEPGVLISFLTGRSAAYNIRRESKGVVKIPASVALELKKGRKEYVAERITAIKKELAELEKEGKQ